MLATGLGLLGALWQWWIGNLEPVRMLILVATAFYLNARDVRELLLSTAERVAAIPLAPPEGGRR
jgi:ribosomal protein L12E/L44/L45/RPP1/RPP2